MHLAILATQKENLRSLCENFREHGHTAKLFRLGLSRHYFNKWWFFSKVDAEHYFEEEREKLEKILSQDFQAVLISGHHSHFSDIKPLYQSCDPWAWNGADYYILHNDQPAVHRLNGELKDEKWTGKGGWLRFSNHTMPAENLLQDGQTDTPKMGFLIWCGRLEEGCRVGDAVWASRWAGKRLFIAADTVDGDFYQKDVAHLLGKDVIFIGQISGHQKRQLLKKARCLISTDGNAVTLTEAREAGTPAVAYFYKNDEVENILPEGVRWSKVRNPFSIVEALENALTENGAADGQMPAAQFGSRQSKSA